MNYLYGNLTLYAYRQGISLVTYWDMDPKTKGKRKVQGVPQSQTAALPRHQEEPASVASFDALSDWRPGVTGSIPAEVGNILSWRLIMEYFLWSFSPFPDSRRAVVSFWRKNMHNTG